MINKSNLENLLSNGTVVDDEDQKVGAVGQIYLDDTTHEPEWVTVKTGMFGGAESFVPLASATEDGSQIRVPYDKAKIKDAPRMDADGSLSEAEEDELYRYYGLSDHDTHTTAGTGDRRDLSGTRGDVGHDTSGPTTDDAMTRSEERLSVGTERRESGRARLRKYVVTETETRTVPVSHEEVRIEREPITDANRGDAYDGPAISEEEHEVVLHEERPVVQKEAVPVERVRLDTETVTEQQTVSEEVRKEQIEIDDATDGKKRRGER